MRPRTTLPAVFLLAVVCAWAAISSAPSAQVPAPRPEHRALEVFAGTWTFEGDIKAVPAAGLTDSGHVTYRHVSQMINGGFFLETRRTGTGTRGPVSELFVYSYNTASKTYRQDGYNNRGVVRQFTGTVEGRTWKFVGTNTSLDGVVTKERFEIVYSPDGATATVRSEHSNDGVMWFERLTGTYRKISGDTERR